MKTLIMPWGRYSFDKLGQWFYEQSMAGYHIFSIDPRWGFCTFEQGSSCKYTCVFSKYPPSEDSESTIVLTTSGYVISKRKYDGKNKFIVSKDLLFNGSFTKFVLSIFWKFVIPVIYVLFQIISIYHHSAVLMYLSYTVLLVYGLLDFTLLSDCLRNIVDYRKKQNPK